MTPVINGASTKYGFTSRTVFSGTGSWSGAIVVRASDSGTASVLANVMSQINRNTNIQYSQDRRTDLYKAGAWTNTTTYADCSSAVSYAVQLATGIKDFNTATGDGTSMANALIDTGYFMNSFNYINDELTPLCEGDIVIYKNGGHTAIVMSGNAMQGIPSELYNSYKDNGYNINWGFFEGEEFEPRTESPVITPLENNLPLDIIKAIEEGEIDRVELEDAYDMYYIYEGRGGYSQFADATLTNKTYAWGRFAEILGCGECCPLPQGDPGSWYNDMQDIFTKDMAPEIGSAMCFVNLKGGSGYACIVEMIHANEVLITSQVENGVWSLKERTKRYGMWDFDNYMFVGYMGAESESALETFLRIAQQQVGSDQSWTMQQTGITSPNGWSAAFIVACSKRAGSSLNIVIPNVDSVSAFGRVGVLRGMGEWHKGSIYGGGYQPSAGDIVIFRSQTTGKESIYTGNKAGIVVESNGGSFSAVVGDDSGTVTQKNYGCSSGFIAGYFSPDWERIDGTTASKKEYRNIQGLYTNGVTKYDASVRTIDNQPSINSSHVKLAAINYTGMLANMYSVFGQGPISTAANSELVVDYWTNTVRSYYQQYQQDFNGVSGTIADISGSIGEGLTSPLDVSGWYNQLTTASKVSVTATVQEVYDYFKAKGLNSAAVTGILANIQAESSFRTGAIGDKGTSAGLVQWHAGRMKSMKEYVGSDWATNVTGQLDYIWEELQTSYSSVLKTLRNVPDTAEGARQATSKWIKSYEIPQGYDDPNSAVYTTRLGYANGFYEQLGG